MGNKTMGKLTVLQMHSGDDLDANLASAQSLIEQAAARGSQVAVLPEVFALRGSADEDQLKLAESESGGPLQDFLSQCAMRNKIWIVGGSIPATHVINGAINEGKTYSSCFVFDDTGAHVASYRKMHLFDVFVEDTGETYGESQAFSAGDDVVVVDSPCGRLGLAICYDLRFPELFRLLVAKGAECIVLPSAFTASTGKAHWHTLIRSRAIENTVFVAAANQGNRRRGERDCFGHSMIVDPWGTILSELGEGVGCAEAEIDLDTMRRIRSNFPCLEHRRLDIVARDAKDTDKMANKTADRTKTKTRLSEPA